MTIIGLKELVEKRVPYVMWETDGVKWLYVIDKEGLQHYHYGADGDPFKHVPDGLVHFTPIDEITEEQMTPFFEKIYGLNDLLQSLATKVIE